MAIAIATFALASDVVRATSPAVPGKPPRALELPAPGAKGLSFVGTQRCVGCHAEQTQRWTGSHHDLAMQPATPATVLGAFDGRAVELEG